MMLIVLFSIPCIGGKTGVTDGIYQAICVLLVFPLIVLAGSGSITTHKWSTMVCKWLGDLSYPLYITHYPLMYMQMNWFEDHKAAPVWMHIVMNLGVVFLSIVLAWGVLKIYDEPVREWLKEHWLKRKK